MMIERRLMFGLEDVKSVYIECSTCRTRISLSPDSREPIPVKCPSTVCGAPWNVKPLNAMTEQRNAFEEFRVAMAKIREAARNDKSGVGFRILFELDAHVKADVVSRLL